MESLINVQNDLYKRIVKARSNYKKSPKGRITQDYIEGRLDNIEKLWEEFKFGHKDLIKSADPGKLKLNIYWTDDLYDKMEEVYIDHKCELLELMKEFAPERTSTERMCSAIGSDVAAASHVRLPKIHIPQFSGKYSEWITFRDLFISMIYNNASLDKVQKLHYLKCYLTGEAEQLIRHIPVSEANFDLCWKQLEERYSNKKYICHFILSRLLGQKVAAKESASYLKDLLDTSTECLSALENIGVNVSSWDIILIHILSLKLDSESRKQWELKVTTNTNSDDLPTFQQFKEFLMCRYRALEFIEPNYRRTDTRDVVQPSVRTRALHVTDVFEVVCEYCGGSHKLCFCKEFISEGYDKRHEFVSNNRICFNCLGSNHSVRFCQKATNCKVCKKRHHSLLHPPRLSSSYSPAENRTLDAAISNTGDNSDAPQVDPIVNCLGTNEFNKQVLLATAIVRVRSRTGDYKIVRALIDPGSQASFVTEATVQSLGLKKSPNKCSIGRLGENNSSVTSKGTVLMEMESMIDSTFKMNVKAHVLQQITGYLPAKRVVAINWVQSANINLADPHFDSPNKIDILLGSDVYSHILQDGIIKGETGSPVAQRTFLGWILSGSVESENVDNNICVMHVHIEEDDELKRFWELESESLSSSKKLLTPDEARCETIFMSTTSRDDEGRYIVKLPFRDDDPSCKGGNSREIAVTRFKNVEKRFNKDQKFKNDYVKVINDYLSLNHMALVEQPDDKIKQAIYLPHHAVIREDKITTKTRVVFDASCKNDKGLSLNDSLLVGPKLQPDLRHIIMRWRSYPVCLTADIIKMYRMIKVTEEDTDYQRIVWRENPQDNIRDYKLLTVTFGTSAAPYLAVKTLNQVACDEGKEYPLAAGKACSEFYMDDLMSGGQTIEEAMQLYYEMNALLQKGGFVLQKWTSNKEKVIEMIEKDKERQGRIEENKEHVEIKIDDVIKILGLTWSRSHDGFQYSVKLPPLTAPVTKRKIISDIARLYDPLGWISPCVISAKVLIQKLWLSGIAWDEEPSTDLLCEWQTYRNELVHLTDFRISRWVGTGVDDSVVELHGFCDASHAAYAAVVYLRVINQVGVVHVSLLAAKTKVAPVKQISIPRLELCGAVLLSKLIVEIAQVLNIPNSHIRAWTDSTVVLAWINKHPSSWKTFVGNRVSEIITHLDSSHWNHVPTKHNPADCASRGLSPTELAGHSLWKCGPNFLHENEVCYIKLKDNETHLEEVIRVHLAAVDSSLLDKYSSLGKLIRVVAFCRRFITRRDQRFKCYPHLTKWELDEAMICCIKLCQTCCFNQEVVEIARNGYISSKSSKIRVLSPFIDDKGVLRVGGRIDRSQVDDNAKHPILLPHDSQFTQLIVANSHEKTLHGGPTLMLNYLRTAYWIVGAKNLVKLNVRKCVTCTRQRARTQTPFMGSLPPARVTPSRAFFRSGVDYAGPFNIKTSKGRGHHAYKGYVCLFVCMVTKAVHIEVVSDLTSRGFLDAFKRFVSRRGHCSELWSDNGTNFVGAAKELQHLFNVEKSNMIPEVAEILATNSITWHFIPPRSPNFGGLWEAGIKATKYHIKRVIGEATLTYEEMATLMCQIEACLNSRPISVLSSNPEDPNPLTPGHFLIGESLLNVPAFNYEESNISSLRRWQLVQGMLQHFWRRWSNEYLTQCMQRYKWCDKIPEPNIGDIVLIKEDNLPPTKWFFGRIQQKHPGLDNVTRVVTLKCKNAIIKRPVSKLCVLPINDNV